jgi:phage replication O-like protein O
MSGFEKQTYTQVPNSLFEIMHEMDECELKVVLYICRYTFGYHRDEVQISTRKLAAAIKMSVASVDKGANAAVDRGLIERVTEGQNSTVWRAIVSDSENESPAAVLESGTPVTQKMNRSVPDNESQVGVKERIKKTDKKKIIINSLVAQMFEDAFGTFYGHKEQTRWATLYDSVGPDRAAELIKWATKKEIHLENRRSLIDSMETAAKNWREAGKSKQTAAQSGDPDKYDKKSAYAEYLA